MYEYEKRNQPNVLSLVKTAGVFVVIAVFSILSLNTGDLLWFWPVFDETPQQIMLRCYGDEIVLTPGQPQFEQFTTLFNDSFSGYKNWDSLTMSEETWQYYQTSPVGVTVFIDYPRPVRVHSFYKYFSSVDKLVVPLDGRHSSSNAVFGMTEDTPGVGSLHVDSFDPVLNYLSGEGLCSVPGE